MVSGNTHNTVHNGRFSTKTLQAIVDVAKKDVQNIKQAIASAKHTGGATTHWEERLRQTSQILAVALKEYEAMDERTAVTQ